MKEMKEAAVMEIRMLIYSYDNDDNYSNDGDKDVNI